MLIVFWVMEGPIIIDFLEKGITVNSASYYHLFRQNSTYLLNNPYTYIYIYTKREREREGDKHYLS